MRQATRRRYILLIAMFTGQHVMEAAAALAQASRGHLCALAAVQLPASLRTMSIGIELRMT